MRGGAIDLEGKIVAGCVSRVAFVLHPAKEGKIDGAKSRGAGGRNAGAMTGFACHGMGGGIEEEVDVGIAATWLKVFMIL